ncbi:MAG: hypothetical protein NTZ64_10860, partial [Polaromonas sp.]|nr:hypothetical protein [Polaromonas sp.]
MGFWSTVGGVISSVSNWAREAVKPIANVVKRVGSWMKDVGQITEAHLEGKNIIIDDTPLPLRLPPKNNQDNRFVWEDDDHLITE